ncbi:MAG: hypothetical protein WC763_05075 [Candidatus Paceibacterota bacterium]
MLLQGNEQPLYMMLTRMELKDMMDAFAEAVSGMRVDDPRLDRMEKTARTLSRLWNAAPR